jgi:3-methyladenine DNA glycosylase AlkD
MLNYIHNLENRFKENANTEIARWQIQYMRNQFGGLGITSPIRKKLQKPFLEKKQLPNKEIAFEIIKLLWEKPEREFQYFAMELARFLLKQADKSDIELYEWLITNKSWWDTVDFIAPDLVGSYFMKFPNEKEEVIKKWMNSGNIWLQRTSLIFQLRYRHQTDTDLLSKNINQLIGSKEFFINKAIGWSLRQYSKFNPEWVEKFVNNNPKLSGLSRREALKIISKTQNSHL